jgi:hypothetical protein
MCVFSLLCTTLRPEDGRAKPKHVVTIGNKIQNQDSCVFRRTAPPAFGISFIHPYKQSGPWRDVLVTGYLTFTHEAQFRFPVPGQYQAHNAIDQFAYMNT